MSAQHSPQGQAHAHTPAHDHDHAHHTHGPRATVQAADNPRPAAIGLHNLTVAYRGHPAVHHLTGEFPAGMLTAVVGPNGAGKSSLMGALSGTLRHFEGHIERASGQRVAYLPQASALDRSFPVRVHEVVAMGLWARIGNLGAVRAEDTAHITQALAAVGLNGFEQRWLGELSAGQAQRVLFARVLVQDANLILLDEPFNAIDARTTADLLNLLKRWKQEARTVIAVLHDMEQVREHFEHALLLAREPVAWGPVAHVLKPEHLFRARQMAEAWDELAAACKVPT
jgi:zinc/manganese transport system ATP-binding protein